MEPETTLTITIKDRNYTLHENQIVKAPYETDAAFFARAQAMLDKLREEMP